MKRLFVIAIATALIGGTLMAQNVMPRPGMGPGAGLSAAPTLQQAEVTKIEGRLELINGFIAIKSRDKTYYVHGLEYLIGFVDGLKEGAQVKIEGFAVDFPAAPEYAHLRVSKLTIGNREYDLSQRQGMRAMGQMMGSRGDRDDDRRGEGRRW